MATNDSPSSQGSGTGGIYGIAGMEVLSAITPEMIQEAYMQFRANEFGNDMAAFLSSLPPTDGERRGAFIADIQGGLDALGSALIPPASAAQASSSINGTPDKLTSAGASFIQSWEQGPKGGVALTQYHSPEGGTDTVGWGHKLKLGESYPNGINITLAQKMFDTDSLSHARLVINAVKVQLTQNQFDALVSLSYNAPAAFDTRNPPGILKSLNKGDFADAADRLLKWNKATVSGKMVVMPG